MQDFLYEDLTFKINGLLFDTFKLIGYGQSEKTYGNAFEELLKKNTICRK